MLGQWRWWVQPINFGLQMQRFGWTYSFPMFKIMGFDLEIRKATKCHQLKCPFFLLEKIWMRNMQINVPLYVQSWPNHLQNYRFNQWNNLKYRLELHPTWVNASWQEHFKEYPSSHGVCRAEWIQIRAWTRKLS